MFCFFPDPTESNILNTKNKSHVFFLIQHNQILNLTQSPNKIKILIYHDKNNTLSRRNTGLPFMSIFTC